MPSFHRLALLVGALLPAAFAAPTAEKRGVVPSKYIVTLKSDASTESHLNWVSEVHSRSLTKRDTVGVEQTYNISSWHAYAGEFDDATLEEIKNNPDVSIPPRCCQIWTMPCFVIPPHVVPNSIKRMAANIQVLFTGPRG